jgi:hypothetical protein
MAYKMAYNAKVPQHKFSIRYDTSFIKKLPVFSIGNVAKKFRGIQHNRAFRGRAAIGKQYNDPEWGGYPRWTEKVQIG